MGTIMPDRSAITDAPHVRARMLAVLTVFISVTVLLFSMVTLVSFDRAISPELHQRTRLIGDIIRAKVEQSVATGIPVEAIAGLDKYLATTIGQFPEIQHLAVVSRRGVLVAEAANEIRPTLLSRIGLDARLGVEAATFSLPILVRNDMAGAVTVTGSAQFAETRLRNVLLDVSVLALAVLLAGVELALAIAAASIWKPLSGINGLLTMQRVGVYTHVIRPAGIGLFRRLARRLNGYSAAAQRGAVSLPVLRFAELVDIRFALFVFVAGTEIAASFLPVYALDAARPGWLTDNLAAALPLACYLVAVMVVSPFGARLVARWGASRLFALATLPTMVSLMIMALASDVLWIALARGGVGIGYAIASISCQEYALRSGNRDEVSQASGTFLAMIYGGTFCGSVLGGVLAQHFGFALAIGMGALLVLAGGASGYVTMTPAGGRMTQGAAPAQAPAVPHARRRYLALTIGVAIPLNLVTAVFVWYLAPLQLVRLGADTSETARVIMLYYLAQIMLGGLVTRSARDDGSRWLALGVGALVVAGAFIALSRHDGIGAMVIGTAAVGIGHALLRGPLLALVTRMAQGAGIGLSRFRIAERLGALTGLLLTTIAQAQVSTAEIVKALALMVLMGAILAGIVDRASRRSGRTPQ